MRLGGSSLAVLVSTLIISVTCIPFWPGLARTSSVAPGGTLPWPLRSTTLACRNASPEPSSRVDETKAFVRVIPFDSRSNGRSRGAIELRTARWGVSEIAGRWLIVVVGKITAAGRTKISISVAHDDFLGHAN